MEELYEAGKIRAIGLSNFLPHHIENILKDCRVRPAVDQIEYHPGYSQEAVVNYCRERGILVQAWSPIGRSRVLDEPLVKETGSKVRRFTCTDLPEIRSPEKYYTFAEVILGGPDEGKSRSVFF